VSPSPFATQRVVADPAYARLKDHLIASTGLAYYADKDGELAGRIAQRLANLGLRDCASYLTFLADGANGEAELDALIADLTIGETFFFRHRELFDALKQTVLPDLIDRNQHSRQLRIWSAGCATGAEPYSVSILLKRELADRLVGWDVTILGTDINKEFLARARAGRFEEWAFRSTPEDVKQACFAPSGSSWLLAPEYREGVSFQYHNLVTHPFPSLLNNLFAFDLILCRNVTIYFSLEIVRRLIEHFHQCLVEGGWLLVGHAEPNIELFRAFRTVNAPGAVLYQKSKEPPSVPSPTSFPFPANRPPAPAPGITPAWSPPSLLWEPQPSPARPVDIPSPAPPSEPARWPQPMPAPPPAQPVRSELDAIRSLADRGEWQEAARRCQNALEKDKLNPVVYFYQALVFEQMGRHVETEHALRRVIYLDRGFVLAHYYLGLLLQKTGQLPQAARSFKNVLQLLTRIAAAHVFADGDGITAGELHQLTQMHLEVLEGA
jgi:chemotaxis protein methyltransferase CheR